MSDRRFSPAASLAVWPARSRRWRQAAPLLLALLSLAGLLGGPQVGRAAAEVSDAVVAAAPLRPLALQLPRVAPAGIHPEGFLVSEKFDGVRAVWDGQVLRARSGAVLSAPAWFLARLPAEPLDGELWLGRGRFDALSAGVRRAEPLDDEWRALRYLVFDLPEAAGTFAQRAERLRQLINAVGWEQLVAVEQLQLGSAAELQARLDAVVGAGGEGLVLHRADALWVGGRSDALLKLKPQDDAEAVVIGHLPGKGRHTGRLGALRVRTPDGREFKLGSGLSDAERDAPPPLGATVTYRHRGLTRSGLPRFASFLRMRDPDL
jgi:DNA ligase-1